MDYLTFISEIIKILIWPLIVITIVLLLRKQIINLITNLKHLKYKDFEAIFYSLQKVNQDIDKVSPPIEKKSIRYLNDKITELKNIAKRYPLEAILETWILIENQLREITYMKLEKITNKYSSRIQLESLVRKNIIPKEIYSIFNDLKNIRNKIAHEVGYSMSISQAERYIDTGFRFLSYLEDIKLNNK